MGTVFLFSDMCATFNGCKSELWKTQINKGGVMYYYYTCHLLR